MKRNDEENFIKIFMMEEQDLKYNEQIKAKLEHFQIRNHFQVDDDRYNKIIMNLMRQPAGGEAICRSLV